MKRSSTLNSSTESGRTAGWIAALIMLGGLAVRLAIAPWGGHPGDLPVLLRWADVLAGRGYLQIYSASDANYPPFALAALGLSGWLADEFGAADTSPVRIALLKLPAILADIGIGWLVWRRGRSIPALAGVVFNPALIYLSAWWGQLESVYMLGALASLFAALDERPFRAGLWLGAGLMVKLQAAVIAPIVIMLILTGGREGVDLPVHRISPSASSPPLHKRRRGRGVRPDAVQALLPLLKWCAGLALALAVALGPFALIAQIGLVLGRMVALVAGPGWLTVNALNFWYLASGGAGNWAFDAPLVWPDTVPLIGAVSPRGIGLVLVALWSAAVLALMILRLRDPSARPAAGSPALLTGSWMFLGMFLWPTQSHERYAFGAVVLLAAGGLSAARHLALYTALTVLHALNLVWAAPFHPALDGWLAGNVVVGMAVAVGMIGCAGWGVWMLGRGDFFAWN